MKHYDTLKQLYIDIIQLHIQNGILTEYQKGQTVEEIFRQTSPTFTFNNIKTWICKGDNGYQIIWVTEDDWNVGWISQSEINFRDWPIFKNQEPKNPNLDDLTPSWCIYCDEDGELSTVVHNDPFDELGFFVKVAKFIAFSDCTNRTIEKIFFKGKEVVYAGWQPGMTFEFKNLDGNTVWKESFPHWDH